MLNAILFVAMLYYLSSDLFSTGAEWYYWTLFSIVKTIANILLVDIIIAVSPEKIEDLFLVSR